MTTRRAAFLYDSELEKYPYPDGHPFNTTRAKKTRDLAESMGWLAGPGIQEVPPEPVDRLTLKKFHSAQYVRTLKAAAEGKWESHALNMGIGSADCPVFEGLYDHAVLATGASLVGARMILNDEVDVAFNPSGGFHHAFPEKAAGFCYLNDVALACTVFAEAGKKVLYLDVDVHNGDGVAYAFKDRKDVMTISLHENPKILFPGTGFEHEIGEGEGKGYCVNLPLPVGTYDMVYLNAFELDADQERPNDDRWTPAEIRACCRLAALLDVPLAQAAQNIVPITATAGESVQRLRNWAGGRCLDAGRSGIYRTAAKASPKSRRKIPRDPSVN